MYLIAWHMKTQKQNTLFTQKEENTRSTSGRGATASYRTMFPEISAR